MNHINDILKELILNINTESDPRELKVKETLFANFKLDPQKTIINYPSRPFNWKYFAGELYWYLLKDRKIEEISKYSSFWKKLINIDGTINSNYGHLYIGEQYKWVFESLKKDKNTRQAVAFYNRPEYQYVSNKDFICTLYNLFFIRDNKLHMKVQMRSSDLWYGISYDAPWFGVILQSLYLDLKNNVYPDLELGYYYHFSDNLHFYERHFNLSEEILKETPIKNDVLILKKPLFSYDSRIQFSDSAKEFISEMRIANGKDVDYKKILNILFEIR